MSGKFYAKSPGNEGYIKNMEVLAYHDADNHYLFQSQLYKTKDGKYYLYGGCFYGYGVEIIDVTDPANPRHVQYMPVMDPEIYPYMSTPKIQIADDLMIVSNGNCLEFLHGPAPEKYTPAPGGVHIFSLKEDPEHPKKLSFWATGDEGNPGAGVHRFTYNGGKYMHLSATAVGFKDFIYRIVDISDPTNPHEVGRWWNPGQFFGNQTKKTREKEWNGWQGYNTYPGFVHFPYVGADDNLAYLSCAGGGFKILDVSNPEWPQVIGECKMTPPFATKFGGALCHTFMPILGTKYAIGMQEGERQWTYNKNDFDKFGVQAMCGIEMFDISNPEDPVLISVFPYPEVPEDFPYTVRLVSQILESNGSSSMATVCAGTLALMDAGVPMKKPVSGIAMGLIKNPGEDKYAVLSDILGDEDHLGDMDFKTTGTKDGLTATQMDIKCDGLSYEILEKALMQAKAGREHILGCLTDTISEPRADFKPQVPRIVQIEIPKEFIGAVIGPGGKIIQQIQEDTNTVITIDEEDGVGKVQVSAPDKEAIDAALLKIKGIVAVPEVGEVYEGTVRSIMPYGCFVEILPGKDGLLHISEIDWKRLETVEEAGIKEGDKIQVKLLEIDDKTGKYKLSHKVLIEKPEGYEERERRPRRPRPERGERRQRPERRDENNEQ